MQKLAYALTVLLLLGNPAGAALIEIGSTKQLFIDTWLIESMTRTRPVMNPAVKVEQSPVLRPEVPWEGNDVRVNAVVYDEQDGLFKMWYSTQTYAARASGDGIEAVTGDGFICFATSQDGIHWDKPVLNLVSHHGSTDNNIVPRESFKPYFFLDTHEQDPAKRYKGFERQGTMETSMQYDLYWSPDGFEWTAYENNPVIDTTPKIGRWGPTNFMGWDPIRNTYAVHMENSHHRNSPMGKRLIGRAESPDMIHWTEPETIIVPDSDDHPDTEFYAMPAIAYEGYYVGLLWNFRTTNVTILPQIVFSRDGIHYNRQFREPFIQRGGAGDFDHAVAYASEPIVHGDKILTYYTGVNWRSLADLLKLGDKAIGAVGLAVTPLDGFVSLDSGRNEFSEMVTRAFSFTGSQLHITMDAAKQPWGGGPCEVRVELLEPNHEVIEGFAMSDADPLTESAIGAVVSWRGQSDLSAFEGKPIKLRFSFRNAKLYSFQFK